MVTATRIKRTVWLLCVVGHVQELDKLGILALFHFVFFSCATENSRVHDHNLQTFTSIHASFVVNTMPDILHAPLPS
jgi:hypothetical protein